SRTAARDEARAVRYNDVLLAQVQQSVACNALHGLEARLCRWLLQTHDCIDGNVIPLTQEFLGQMLGVRRTTVTIAAQLLQSAGLIRYRRGSPMGPISQQSFAPPLATSIASLRARSQPICRCRRQPSTS